jgi:hypothetical protein
LYWGDCGISRLGISRRSIRCRSIGDTCVDRHLHRRSDDRGFFRCRRRWLLFHTHEHEAANPERSDDSEH